jgi:hypothetical protein
VDSVRITHRKAKGVRIINLYEGDSVIGVGKCASEKTTEEDEEVSGQEIDVSEQDSEDDTE